MQLPDPDGPGSHPMSNQQPNPGFLSANSNLTTVVLVTIDMTGLIVMFNLFHWLITDTFATDLLLTWKLLIILCLAFLYNYLMDLYTFNSPLGQLGMLERSFISMLLTGITVAVAVFIIGPSFIGGFVGRGVLAGGLIASWLWSLGFRYIANRSVIKQRSRIQWLLLTERPIDWFVEQFHLVYQYENILVLTKNPDDQYELDSYSEVVGSWGDLTDILKKEPVTGIITTTSDLPSSLINSLMNIRISGTRIYSLNDFYEQYLSRIPVYHLDQNWIATTGGFDLIHNPIGLKFKRYIDVVISIAGLVLGLPIILGTALLVLFTSGLPIFYQQLRTGENGKPITIYKFRTMVNEAEKDGAQYASENDPRFTLCGKFLRKFRLDELPQFYNVIKGDMSFIGPRPERPEFIAELQKSVPYYNLRHLVKPGLTGWAQVMYGYGDSEESAVEKLQYDLFYIKNYSLILDISILLKSIKVILFGTGR